MPPVAQYWKRGGTDWSSAGNWQTSTGSGSTVPVSTDTPTFAEGSDDITAGLSQSAVDLGSCYIGPGFSGRIGSNGTSLVISCAGTFTYEARRGHLYLTAGSADITNVSCAADGAELYLTGGAITAKLDVASFCWVNDQTGLSGVAVHVSAGAVLTVKYKSDGTDPTVVQSGGSSVIERPCTSIEISGGDLTLNVDKEAVGSPLVTISGGVFRPIRGTITNLVAKTKGLIDFSGLTGPLTVTDSTFGPEVVVIPSKLVTFTNTPTLLGTRSSAFANPTGSRGGASDGY